MRITHCSGRSEKSSRREPYLQILESDPDAARVELTQGRILIPLHIALVEQVPLEIITAILDKYPDAVREKTDDKLPLHIACEQEASIEVITALLKAYPESVRVI